MICTSVARNVLVFIPGRSWTDVIHTFQDIGTLRKQMVRYDFKNAMIGDSIQGKR